MFARITRYKMKPDSIDAAIALMEKLKPQILGMPGMVRFVNAIDETGAGYVVSIVDSKEVSDTNQASVNAMWAQFSEYLEGHPAPEGYELVADWSS